MQYLLSIVIPTRNRQKYALAAVKQIYNVTDERVQIVISDNSDDDSLQKNISAHKFSGRVKYKYIPERIPGVDNYINGITMSDGEYLCNIGDDDGIMRYIADVVEWAKRNDIEAITPLLSCQYFWPGVFEDYKDGKMIMSGVEKEYYKLKSPQEGLIEIIKSGGVNYYHQEVAKMYHAVVKKECFDKVKQISGSYCGGLVPDVYLSTAFSLVVKEVLFLGIPLTIPGICPESESGRTANKKDHGKLKDFTYWCGQDYTWSKKVPFFYSSSTIWADSLMHALEDMGAYDMADLFSLKDFTIDCMRLYPKYKKELLKFYYENTGSHLEDYEPNKASRNKSIAEELKVILIKTGAKLPEPMKRFIKKMLRMKTTMPSEQFGLNNHPDAEDIIKAEELVYNFVKEDVDVYLKRMKNGEFGLESSNGLG